MPAQRITIRVAPDGLQAFVSVRRGAAASADELRAALAAVGGGGNWRDRAGVGRPEDCLRLMRMSAVLSVPVVRGLTPVGVLSFTDVLRAVASG